MQKRNTLRQYLCILAKKGNVFAPKVETPRDSRRVLVAKGF